jgi:hypothetical protein
MNDRFKEEFKQLNPDDIKTIINGCANNDILEFDINKTLDLKETSYHISYIDNEEDYGYWVIQWKYKKISNPHMPMSTWTFENYIKITPFRLEFENKNTSFNPYTNHHHKKQLEEYIFIYINKCCPNYINAIKEETDRFINMITIPNIKKPSR